MLCILQNTLYYSSLYDRILRAVSVAPYFDIYTHAKLMVLTVRNEKDMGCLLQ
jgi:hypothetical protein